MINELQEDIAKICQTELGLSVPVRLERTDKQFGDFATNIALQLAGRLGKNPREIAEPLASKIMDLKNVHTAMPAGPGFINITLTQEALWQMVGSAPEKVLEGQVILTEYSDPNPLKPLHAGHLYTTLVGDIVSRLLETAGAKVTRINYGGDVGLHVGKSMWAIIKNLGGEQADKLAEIPVTYRPAWLGARYVEGNDAYEDDEQARAEIIEVNKRVYQLHADNDHESAFAKIYWTVRQWSYDYFNQLYKELQVVPFDRFIPESEIVQLGLDIVREQLKRGVYKESQGAVVFVGEPYGLHTRVFINSQGLPTYETKDVGLLERKWQDYHFDKSIVITASEQMQYYQVMLKSVEQFNPEVVQRSTHLTHGVVKLAGGIKMSSRKGNIVSAMDIIEAAHQAGRESGFNPSHETTLAAIKYAFAKNRIGGDIAYDPKESVAIEGNSGPYLQYAHARACSILAKAEKQSVKSTELDTPERDLLRKISEYQEVVAKATNELMPHHVCTYLYELAQEFNSFYEKSRIIDDPREEIRLKLVELYSQTLKEGLNLLGIEAPERM